MKRSTTRILTTHTGSLPRPLALLELLNAKEAGTLSDHNALHASVKSAVAEVVKQQVDAAVDMSVMVNSGKSATRHT